MTCDDIFSTSLSHISACCIKFPSVIGQQIVHPKMWWLAIMIYISVLATHQYFATCCLTVKYKMNVKQQESILIPHKFLAVKSVSKETNYRKSPSIKKSFANVSSIYFYWAVKVYLAVSWLIKFLRITSLVVECFIMWSLFSCCKQF